MTDIFNIPLYYISFTKNSKLEKNLAMIGFNNINHFKAIDGRNFDIDGLIEDNVISIRTYNDLNFGREQHSGIPKLGGVGCTLSHRSLWKLCIDNDMPYIIIAEDDVHFKQKISQKDIKYIQKTLEKEKSGFFSCRGGQKIKKGEPYFFGTHFYIISQECAKQLYKYALPIDLQTDSYIMNLNNRGKINIEGYNIVKQKSHTSSIQDFCIKCFLPNKIFFYLIILVIFIVCLILIPKLTKCPKLKN
jgi:GR25 family glycosyltransferase involved in LPS biosynthesis